MNIPKFLKSQHDDHATPEADLGDMVENEIARLVPKSRGLIPMPRPVNEPDDITQRAGQLSATAMGNEFERAAKDIEALGEELIDLAKKCESAMIYIQKSIEHIGDTADHYRKEATRIRGQIEDYAALAEDVRRTSELMRQRVMSGEPLPKEPEVKEPEAPQEVAAKPKKTKEKTDD
jgi:hypothetical protein